MRTNRHPIRCLLMLAVLISFSSCMQGPREKLMGRWYTSDTSIRFRPDGTVVYSTPRGLARGRYFFDETPKDLTSTSPHPNLILELVRGNQQFRLDFEVELLSQDRIRLSEIRPTVVLGRSVPSQFKILKRANTEDEKPSPTLAAAPTSG